MAIGWGEVLTPLQINAFYGAIANNGLWVQPFIKTNCMSEGTYREQVIPLTKKEVTDETGNPENNSTGFMVCYVSGGTRPNARINGATIYLGKPVPRKCDGRKTHAWFCGYLVRSYRF